MLILPDVTLCCVDTVCPELAAISIHESCSKVKFAAVNIWTNDPDQFWGHFPNQAMIHMRHCHARSHHEVAKYIWEVVPRVVETTHVLIQHWDSWVLNPDCWEDDFLKYDYIGAPWWYDDNYNVGNGGFCLKSVRLCQRVGASRLYRVGQIPEDAAVCRINRYLLEPDFKFASLEVAKRFSFERIGFKSVDQHFGFHGVFNFPKVLGGTQLFARNKMMQANNYLRNKKEVEVFAHGQDNEATTW